MPERLFQEKREESTARITGILDRITYHNEENGYTVARLLVEADEKETVTVVGFLSGVPVGSTLTLTGVWITDSRYGRQFKLQNYEIVKPNTINGIERYLGSGLIKGIGPAYAARIVARFGLKTLDILENDPDRLREVDGLGRARVESIKAAWQEQREIHRIMVFLQGHGVSATYAVKIYKTYGRKALAVAARDGKTVISTAEVKAAAQLLGLMPAPSGVEEESLAPAYESPGDSRGRLIVKVQGKPEQAIALNGSHVLIGRDRLCDICVDDTQVSRLHGLIARAADGVYYLDLGSTNGSAVNGETAQRLVLANNDVIAVGDVRIIYLLKEAVCAEDIDLDATDTFEIPSIKEPPPVRSAGNGRRSPRNC